MNIESLLNKLLPKKVIVNCDRDQYLHRWHLLRTKRFAIFIHKFIRSDEDRALHDHPWPFVVIPIWRGYMEHREQPRVSGEVYASSGRVFPIIGTRARPATYRHRVELLPCDYKLALDLETDCPKCAGRGELPSWSIFIRFTEWREWGFWLPSGFQQWNKWWQEKCE